MKIKINNTYLVKDDLGRAYVMRPKKGGIERSLNGPVYIYRCVGYRLEDGNRLDGWGFQIECFVDVIPEDLWESLERMHEAYHSIMIKAVEPIITNNINSFN